MVGKDHVLQNVALHDLSMESCIRRHPLLLPLLSLIDAGKLIHQLQGHLQSVEKIGIEAFGIKNDWLLQLPIIPFIDLQNTSPSVKVVPKIFFPFDHLIGEDDLGAPKFFEPSD